ncbi:MAG: hypothetical protein VYE04_04890 [Pseudomonadota bacterium]|nr:hypothetical protein [Pseudomonadota bacterium]
MKLRIRGNTVRLRLTRGEVDALEAGDVIEETTQFPDGSELCYCLVPGREEEASQHSNDQGHTITIEVPRARAASWARSDEVGYSGEDPFQVGPLAVLIEKDFSCITPREGEEDLDTYPNPNAASV